MRASIKKYLSHIQFKERKNLVDKITLHLLIKYREFRKNMARNENKIISDIYLRMKDLERTSVIGKFSFVSFNELVYWTNDWIKRFPEKYDVIVGVPRSGLLVGSIIALKLGKPLTTPDLFIRKQYFNIKKMYDVSEIKNVLLVDDSSSSGESLINEFNKIKNHYEDIKICKASLIITKQARKKVDFYYRIIPEPRLFEWNLLHAKKGKTAMDFDGVLSENCPPGIDFDEDKYKKWLKNAKPYLIPAFEIDAIVSNRLEKYRMLTEDWLKKNKVKYKKLYLWNLKSKAEREEKHIKNKVDLLKQIKPDIYFESDYLQAKEIWENTKIPTVCVDEMIIFK